MIFQGRNYLENVLEWGVGTEAISVEKVSNFP